LRALRAIVETQHGRDWHPNQVPQTKTAGTRSDGGANQLMMWGLGNVASVPDAVAFYALLYSGNFGSSNYAK